MQSTYFNPNGHESAMAVVHAFGDPFLTTTFYAHMQRHQAKDVIDAERRFSVEEATKLREQGITPNATALVKGVEGEVGSTGQHESGLDEFIAEGRAKLLRREMSITATTYLQAIKIKADIERTTKDRRLDMVKTLMGAAYGGKSVQKTE